MIILSLPCLISGVALAGFAPKRASHQAAIETTAGCWVVLGLCLIGAGLPLFR